MAMKTVSNTMGNNPKEVSLKLMTMISNMKSGLSSDTIKAVDSFLKTLSQMGKLDEFANNLNKLDQLQGLLANKLQLTEQVLLDLLGPFFKAAEGEDDELTKKEKKAAADRIISFFGRLSKAHELAAMSLMESGAKTRQNRLEEESALFKEEVRAY